MSNIDTYKEKLVAEQKNLHEQLTDIGIQNPTTPEDWIANPGEPAGTEADENVRADRSEEWIERRSEVAVLETRYNNVLRALSKIEAGTYGICEVCNAPIEDDRLNANPAARTCIAHIDDESQLPS